MRRSRLPDRQTSPPDVACDRIAWQGSRQAARRETGVSAARSASSGVGGERRQSRAGKRKAPALAEARIAARTVVLMRARDSGPHRAGKPEEAEILRAAIRAGREHGPTC